MVICQWASPPTSGPMATSRAGFKKAALILDETFVTPNTHHQTLETRTAMAYWQNGKVYLHCSTQSVSQTVDAVARWLHVEPKDVIIVSAYTGRRIRQQESRCRSPASSRRSCPRRPAAPVMMRISREEEHAIGGARPSIHGRLKVGFAKDGRITAVDLFAIVDNGPYEQQFERSATRLDCVAALSAAGDALARHDGAHEYASEACTEPARRRCRASRSWNGW